MNPIDQEAVAPGRIAAGWARWRWPLMIGGPVLILGVAAWFVLTGGKSETTDDAYVQTAKAPISTAINGRVIEIDVTENQPVKAGQVLFKLDPADEEAAARRADAALASAQLQVVGLRSAYDQARLVLGSALQTQAFAAREAARQRALVGAGVASRQQAAEAAHTAELAGAQAAVARQQVAAALANLGAGARAPGAYPAVLQAVASREATRLDLSRTVVKAPADGVVARVDQLQVGRLRQRRPDPVLSALRPALGGGQLQGEPAARDAGRPAGGDPDRRLWKPRPGRACGQLQPRGRSEFLRPAGPERHRQLGRRSSSACRSASPSMRPRPTSPAAPAFRPRSPPVSPERRPRSWWGRPPCRFAASTIRASLVILVQPRPNMSTYFLAFLFAR